METGNKDPELEVELQELYLSSKQWLSDLKFLEEEGHFLDEQLSVYSSTLSIGDTNQRNLAARIKNAHDVHTCLKQQLENFMNRIEPLIIQTDPALNLQLAEDFVNLQTNVQNALTVLKGIKYALVEARRAA